MTGTGTKQEHAPQQSPTGNHERLRHDNQDGTPTAVASSPTSDTRTSQARSELANLQEAGFQMTGGALPRRGRSRRGRRTVGHSHVELTQLVLEDAQIQEIIETAIEDVSEGSSLLLSPSQMKNINEAIFEKLRNLLANGDLSGVDEKSFSEEFANSLRQALERYRIDSSSAEEIAKVTVRNLHEFYTQLRTAEQTLVALAAEDSSKQLHALTTTLDVVRGLSAQQRKLLFERLESREVDVRQFIGKIFTNCNAISSANHEIQLSLEALLLSGAEGRPAVSAEEFEKKLLDISEELVRYRYVAFAGAKYKPNPDSGLIEHRERKAVEALELVQRFFSNSSSVQSYLTVYAERQYVRNALSWASEQLYELGWQEGFLGNSEDKGGARAASEKRKAYFERISSDRLLKTLEGEVRAHSSRGWQAGRESAQFARERVLALIKHWDDNWQESGKKARDLLDDLSTEQFWAADRIFRAHDFGDGRSLYQGAKDEHSTFGTDDQIAYDATRGYYSNERCHTSLTYTKEELDSLSGKGELERRRGYALESNATVRQAFRLLDARSSAESTFGIALQVLSGTDKVYRERLSQTISEITKGECTLETLFQKRVAELEEKLSQLSPQLHQILTQANVDLLSDETLELIQGSVMSSPDGAQVILLCSELAEVHEAERFIREGTRDEEREKKLFVLRIEGYGAVEGSQLAQEESSPVLLNNYAERRAHFFQEWYGIGSVRVEQVIAFQYAEELFKRSQERWRKLGMIHTVRRLAYKAGRESEIHENENVSQERLAILKSRTDEYVRRMSPYLSEEFQGVLTKEYEDAFAQGIKRGKKLHFLTGELHRTLTGRDFGLFTFEDNEEFYKTLRQIQPDERDIVEAAFYDRFGVTLSEYMHDEFGGYEYDLAHDLYNHDFGAAAASEMMVELTRFWGPREENLSRIVSEGAVERERFEEVFGDRYAKDLEHRINQARRAAHGQYPEEYIPLVSIDNVTDAINVCLSGEKRRLIDSVYKGDAAAVLAVQAYRKFGVFTDDSKGLGLLIEGIVQGAWTWDEEAGTFKLDSRAAEKLRAFEGKFESFYGKNFREFLIDQLGGSPEFEWCNAVLEGDRIGADAARHAFSFHRMGTDELLSFETFEQARALILQHLKVSEIELQRNETERKRFEKYWEIYKSKLEQRYEKQYHEKLTDRARQEFDDSELVIFDVLSSGGQFTDVHRIRLAMGGDF
ncbi:MAG: hypothetical protein KDD70_08525, partial [Bdellovibrionales bacterium]|nr:hypothetical protein [Bdellovibrionales bacterium]